LIVHEPLAGRAPFTSATMPVPATTVTVPPHAFASPYGSLTVVASPTIAKAFGAAGIGLNEATTLTFISRLRRRRFIGCGLSSTRRLAGGAPRGKGGRCREEQKGPSL
jgi:hypothetical protein